MMSRSVGGLLERRPPLFEAVDDADDLNLGLVRRQGRLHQRVIDAVVYRDERPD